MRDQKKKAFIFSKWRAKAYNFRFAMFLSAYIYLLSGIELAGLSSRRSRCYCGLIWCMFSVAYYVLLCYAGCALPCHASSGC
jgi:hypothetical protein